ncbi:MAG: MATE family efflux transporter [Lachnospiraceae bacterium]|nr:MATE family efflux transporter [Lachnospiraceae bacterium]
MSAFTRNSNDLTVGNPLKVILFFALPIFVGNIFQQLYNVVDTVVVGHVLKEDALAAVGASGVVYSLIISLANGMTSGFSIIIARYFGAKEYDTMRRAIAITMVLTAVISVLLTVVSMIGLRPLLAFLNTPAEIMNQADTYIRTVLAAIVITMSYNMFAGMLRAIGNSVMPLVFLIVSCIINIILDIVFVKYVGLGIRGAAIATVVAQVVSVILCVLYIIQKCPILRIGTKDFKWDGKITADLFTTGLSMGMMYAIVSVGTVALQSAINGFGKLTIAAHTSARKIGDLFMLPLGTLSMSASTFASQNYGAMRMERIKEGIKGAFKIAFCWCTICNVLVFLGSDMLVKLITGSTEVEVLATASKYLRINLPFYYVLSILLILRSTLQGVGRRIAPLMASTVELILKFTVAAVLAPMMGYLGVCICEPIVWIVCAVMVLIDFYFMNRGLKLISSS